MEAMKCSCACVCVRLCVCVCVYAHVMYNFLTEKAVCKSSEVMKPRRKMSFRRQPNGPGQLRRGRAFFLCSLFFSSFLMSSSVLWVEVKDFTLCTSKTFLITLLTHSSFFLVWSHLPSQPLTIQAPQVLLRVEWSIPMVPSWVTVSRFLAGNRVAELKPITFSSLLLFRYFLSFLLSWPPAIQYL